MSGRERTPDERAAWLEEGRRKVRSAMKRDRDRRASRGMLAMATEFTIQHRDPAGLVEVKVSYRGPDSWAVLCDGRCVSRSLRARMEPLPSARTDRFLKAYRMPLKEALDVAERAARRVNGQMLRRMKRTADRQLAAAPTSAEEEADHG